MLIYLYTHDWHKNVLFVGAWINISYSRNTESGIEESGSEIYYSKESENESSYLASIWNETQSSQIDSEKFDSRIDPTIISLKTDIEYADKTKQNNNINKRSVEKFINK